MQYLNVATFKGSMKCSTFVYALATNENMYKSRMVLETGKKLFMEVNAVTFSNTSIVH